MSRRRWCSRRSRAVERRHHGRSDGARDRCASSTTDATGDALAPYSSLLVTPAPANVPAGDFTAASVAADAATGGFTVTLGVRDLSAAALNQALTQSKSGSLVWAWRFTNGWQDAAAVAKWSPAGGFKYGFDDYTTDSGTAAAAAASARPTRAAHPIHGLGEPGQPGTITLTVPASLLHPLGPNDAVRTADADDRGRRLAVLRRHRVLVRERVARPVGAGMDDAARQHARVRLRDPRARGEEGQGPLRGGTLRSGGLHGHSRSRADRRPRRQPVRDPRHRARSSKTVERELSRVARLTVVKTERPRHAIGARRRRMPRRRRRRSSSSPATAASTRP